MTEQYKCQSYYDDDGILKDCTCGKCGNTPDTEWEKKIQELKSLFIELEISLSIQETAKIALCIREVESLLSSRDTYWKERVEGIKFDIEALRGSPRDTDIEYARAITDVHKILDTLLDNLK